MSRCIRTRAFEALVTEIALYVETLANADDYGDAGARRVYGFPFIMGDSIVPRQINVSSVPFAFDQDTGGVTDSLYQFEVVFVFPRNVLRASPGTKLYFDDIDGLRLWLFGGGSVPNHNSRLQDPDNAGQLINNRIARWQELPASVGPAGVEVPIIVGFETREDRAGERL